MSDDPGRQTTRVFCADDHRIVVAQKRSVVGWVFFSLIFILFSIFAAVYLFRPTWLGGGQRVARSSGIVAPSQYGASIADFSGLYQRYKMPPLDAALSNNPKVNAWLAILQREPCDKPAIFQASLKLENSGAIRESADMLEGFANACPDSDNELYRASELFYSIGDYATAIKLSSDVLNVKPDQKNAYFVRAKAEQGLKRDAAAIADFATLIRLVTDTKSLVSDIFTRMSDSYVKLGRPCEAIGPLQSYIALDNQTRATPPLLQRIDTLAAEGHCALAYARGAARIPLRSNGVSTTKVNVNGIEGTFILDTGASFVTLSRRFADLVKPRMLATGVLQMQTANGSLSATLTTLKIIKLGGLSASDVPAIVASKSIGDNIDGLLGMSFLSRFSITIQNHEMRLDAKRLKE